MPPGARTSAAIPRALRKLLIPQVLPRASPSGRKWVISRTFSADDNLSRIVFFSDPHIVILLLIQQFQNSVAHFCTVIRFEIEYGSMFECEDARQMLLDVAPARVQLSEYIGVA